MRVLALIPAYNEAENLPRVVDELRRTHPEIDIVVVDDASTDGSGDLVPQLGVNHLQLGQHLGLGGALRAGLRYARTLRADAVLRLDGDGQHDPAQIDSLLGPVVDGEADVVVGSRFKDGGSYPQGIGLRVMRTLMACALSRLMNRPITDPTSGFWAFGPRALRLLADHHPRGYPEPELHLFLHRNRLNVVEVAVTMRQRLRGRSSLGLGRASLALLRTALAMIIVPLRRPEAGTSHG